MDTEKSPRWQHGKNLNSPPHGHTESTPTYGTIPPEEMRDGLNSFCVTNDKETKEMTNDKEGGRRDRHMVTTGNPTSNTANCSTEGP